MGNIDKRAHGFLQRMKKRDPVKANKLMDVISVQHAKWIAKRLRRCLGFHNQPLTGRKGEEFSGQRLHDRSKQGKRGEFPRLQRALSQQFSDLEPRSGSVTRSSKAKQGQNTRAKRGEGRKRKRREQKGMLLSVSPTGLEPVSPE